HLDFLAALPFDCRIEPAPGQTLAICHATPWSISERVPADAPDSLFRRFLRTAGAAVVVYGHIHVAHARFVDGGLVANCGSVGFPLDGTPRASYLVARWEPAVGWSVTHRRVPFDVDAVVSDMTSVGLPGAAERGEELRRAGG
ncbi:MAG: metallophosphoesterase family protein, partial [Clostridia bacterium]|nr:metallophosphoesterase family protein [Clostridia bacterium]